jgi:hypothetical protein
MIVSRYRLGAPGLSGEPLRQRQALGQTNPAPNAMI